MYKIFTFSYKILLILVVSFFSIQLTHAANPVQRGNSTSINWHINNASNCVGTTDYSDPSDGIYQVWKEANGGVHTVNTNGDGSIPFTKVLAPPGSYIFTCTHYDVNGVADASGSATLVVTDCATGTMWNSTALSCISTTPTSSHTVTFDSNGGTGSMTPQSIPDNTSANLDTNNFTRSGFNFIGWSNTPGYGQPVAYTNGGSYTIGTADVTLYAQWSSVTLPTPTGLSVTPSTTPSPCGQDWLNLSWNAAVGATSYDVFRDGSAVILFSTSSLAVSDIGLTLGSTHSYTVRANGPTGTSPLSPSASGTVAPVCPSTFTVTPSAGSHGTITPPNPVVNVAPGTTVSFNITPAVGYTIDPVTGSCGGSLSGNTYTTLTIWANCTVSATFSPIVYTVTFDGNGATTNASPTSKIFGYGSSIAPLPTAPAKNGFTFTGWNKNINGLGESVTGSTIVTSSFTAYAQWTPIIIPITGLSVTPSTTPSPCGQNWLNLSWNSVTGASSYEVFRDGTHIAGLDTIGLAISDPDLIASKTYSYVVKAKNSTGTVFAQSPSVSGIVTPVCPSSISHIVTFNGNNSDGGNTAPQSIPENTSYNLTANGFTRSGYTFAKWTKLADGSGTSYTDTAPFLMGTSDVTLYAQWTSGGSSCANTSEFPPLCPAATVDSKSITQNGTSNAVIKYTCSNATQYTVLRDTGSPVVIATTTYTGQVTIPNSVHNSISGNYTIYCWSGNMTPTPGSLMYSSTALPTNSIIFKATPVTIKAGTVSTLTWSIDNPVSGCKITATKVCGATCIPERTADVTQINNELKSTTDLNDPYGPGRDMVGASGALTTEAVSGGAKALGKKSIRVNYTTDLELSCPSTTSKKIRIQVTNENEG